MNSAFSVRNSFVPSPAWHGDVLAARAERVAKGEAQFHEWADVKERLLQKKA